MVSAGQKLKVETAELDEYHSLSCEEVLSKVSEYLKADPTFAPIKNGHTYRWHLFAGGRQFELLTTGPKFFDTRAKQGGGGAVDLVMHLFNCDFKQAISRLREVV